MKQINYDSEIKAGGSYRRFGTEQERLVTDWNRTDRNHTTLI